jgi:hypothetical protein
MRYTGSVTNAFVQSMAVNFDDALRLMAAALSDCPDRLWEASMWPVPALDSGHKFLGPDWKPVTDPAQRRALVQRWVERWSTPWSVAWHALEVLDYDLSGDFESWAPPPPFAGHPHWRDLPSLPAAWSRSELLAYIDYCRARVSRTLDALTEDAAARPLPATHRYHGMLFGVLVGSIPLHVVEHASQIRQFLTAAGVNVQPRQ